MAVRAHCRDRHLQYDESEICFPDGYGESLASLLTNPQAVRERIRGK